MDPLLYTVSKPSGSHPRESRSKILTFSCMGIAALVAMCYLVGDKHQRDELWSASMPKVIHPSTAVLPLYPTSQMGIRQMRMKAITADELHAPEARPKKPSSANWAPLAGMASAVAAFTALMYQLGRALSPGASTSMTESSLPNTTAAAPTKEGAEMPLAQIVGPMIQWIQSAAVDMSGDQEKYAITSDRPLKVIIAGGGVGGLVAARAMQLKGMDVTVLEKTSAFKRFGGPIQLASNALATLKAIDEGLFNKVMDKFTFTGTRVNGIVDGKRDTWFCEFWPITAVADNFDLPYTGVINRPDLQELCLTELRSHNPDCVINGAVVQRYEMKPDNEGVVVTLEDGRTMEADVLVGADGIWSNIRAQMYNEQAKGPGSGTLYSGYTVFAGETVLQTEDYFDVGYKVYIGPGKYFVTSDVGEGRIQWYAFLALPADTKVPAGERRAFLSDLFEGWSRTIHIVMDATADEDFEQRDLYDRAPELSRSWSSGKVTMLGDAVHPMMPNLGQGGGQAMEDAYILSTELANVTDRRQIPRVLQEYYLKRIARVSAIQGLSRLASDMIINTFTTPWYPNDNVQEFRYLSVMTALWRPILPIIFLFQFGYLYSYHPTTMEGQMPELVERLKARHRRDAEAAWEKKAQGGAFVRPSQFS